VSNRRRAVVRLAWCAALLGASRASAQAPSAQELAEVLRGRWDSIRTLEYTCEEHLVAVDGAPAEPRAHFRYDMSHQHGGLTSYSAVSVSHGGPSRTITRLVEDGKRRYGYNFLHPEEGDVLDSVTIRRQEGVDSGLADTTMMSVMWLTTPGGRPLHEHAGRATGIGWVEADGRRQLEMIFPHEGSRLRGLLDPEHDWLASSMEFLGDEPTSWRVETFRRDGDRWFPGEGRFTSAVPGNVAESRFTVTDLKINRPIPASRFAPLALPRGASIDDTTKGTRRVSQGNAATRLEFLEEHGSRAPRVEAEGPRDPVVVEPEPEGRNWGLVLASASAVLLAIGGLLRVVRRD